jgi:hypothetical protein
VGRRRRTAPLEDRDHRKRVEMLAGRGKEAMREAAAIIGAADPANKR